MKRVCFVIVVLMTTFSVFAGDDLKVLFIGNSYTGCVKGTINKLLKESPYKNSKFEYINPGGRTLDKHWKNPKILEKIKKTKWDYVVLQDQSQTPGLPGLKKKFMTASAALCKLIKENGSKPVFYMTWGRRDGDSRNKAHYPDYKTMQKKLTDSYTESAKANGALMAPVGLVWSASRDALKDDYAVLYRKDGSHPSGQGAFLVACVFFRTLFKSDLAFVKPANDQEKLIKAIVLKHK